MTMVSLCVFGGCAAPTKKHTPTVDAFIATLDTQLPQLLEEFPVPGVAVGLIQRGEIVFKKGYGYADLEKKQPVTPQTGFNIGSISKTVTAWGVMRLVEQGKLELDTPAEKYLERWHLPESEFDGNGVTVRRLLSHTAGLSLHGYPGWGPDGKLPSIEESLSGRTNGPGDVRLIMEPGTQWKYSGGGYTLAQLLVEEVTDQKFAAYMKEQVLEPLGMQHSSFELTPDILAGSSQAYDELGEPIPSPRFTAVAAAGLHTTIEDLSAFAAAALKGREGRVPGRGVLKPETIALMLEAAPASNGRYGLGYSRNPIPNSKVANGHGGGNRGWIAFFQIVPETSDGFVIVTNSSVGGRVSEPVHRAWVEWLTGMSPDTVELKEDTKSCQFPVGERLLIDDFESGELANWCVGGGGAGSWFVYDDGQSPPDPSQTDPNVPFNVPDPPQGAFAAVTDMNGPGARMLYGDLKLGDAYTLRLTVFYVNGAPSFSSPDTLVPQRDQANQQYRIDLINPSAPIGSLAESDVLANIFRTSPGDPNRLKPTPITFDLSAWQGQTVRIRLAGVDNRGPLRAGVDDVRLERLRE